MLVIAHDRYLEIFYFIVRQHSIRDYVSVILVSVTMYVGIKRLP